MKQLDHQQRQNVCSWQLSHKNYLILIRNNMETSKIEYILNKVVFSLVSPLYLYLAFSDGLMKYMGLG